DAVKRRVRLERNAANVRIQLFQAAGCAHEGSAGAEDGDKVGDTSLRLLPDLVGRAMVVSLPVGVVGILVGVVIKIRMLDIEFARHADRAIGSVAGICIDDVRAVGVQDSLPFLRNIFRHAERNWNALGGADHGVGNASVAAGGVEQNLAGSYPSAAFCLGDDVGRGAVLNRSA